jgi:ribosomal protein S27E
MKNPPPPPKKIGNCAMDCGNTYPSPGPDVICLNCGSSIIKPELPKDRIGCNV